MGVDVAVAVAEVLHQPGGGVADDQRDGLVEHGERVAFGCLVGGVDRVRARGEREVDDGVRQVYIAFRHPEEVARLIGREGDLEGAAVREADVLAREADQPPRDVERVLARLEHAREPVDGGVGVAVAHRLVQGGNEIIVFLAVFVVEQGLL